MAFDDIKKYYESTKVELTTSERTTYYHEIKANFDVAKQKFLAAHTFALKVKYATLLVFVAICSIITAACIYGLSDITLYTAIGVSILALIASAIAWVSSSKTVVCKFNETKRVAETTTMQLLENVLIDVECKDVKMVAELIDFKNDLLWFLRNDLVHGKAKPNYNTSYLLAECLHDETIQFMMNELFVTNDEK